MTLKQYQKMKNSGIEWIGDIPEQWKVERLKFLVRLRTKKLVDEENSRPYIGLENIESRTGRLLSLNEEMEESDAKLFEKNDVLLGKLRPYLAKVWLAPMKGRCSSEFLVLESKSYVPNYLANLLLSDGSIKIINSSTYGAKMPRAEWSFIGNMYLPVPKLEEQKQIANFLDKYTSKIDSDIQKNQKLIELFKEKRQAVINRAITKGLDPTVPMKDSGIDGIGKIPINWNLTEVRFVLRFIKSGVSRLLSLEDLGYPVLRSTNIQAGKLDLNEVKYWHKKDPQGVNLTEYVLDNNDVILNFINSLEQIGKACLFTKQERDWIYTTNVFRIKTLVSKMLPKYFIYVLNSILLHEQIRAITQPAVNQASFTKDDFKQLLIVYPETEEQKQIIGFLDKETSKLDLLIDKSETQIEKLGEFRQAVISSAVTGKIDVRQTQTIIQ